MIPYLPPELIRPIIESCVSHSPRYKAYGDRQYTLRQVCLVSRMFCAIAQPLLRQNVLIDNASKIQMVTELASSMGWTDVVRKMVISTGQCSGLSHKVRELALVFPNVTDLAVSSSHKSTFDPVVLNHFFRACLQRSHFSLTAVLDSFPNLDLQTCEIKCYALFKEVISKKIRLTNLVSLTLISKRSELELYWFLSRQSLPSLRILSLPTISGVGLSYLSLHPRFHDLLVQLDSIFLSATSLSDRVLTFLTPFLFKTLVDLDTRDPQLYYRRLPELEHIRVPVSRRSLEGVSKGLEKLKSLYLCSVYLHIRYIELEDNADLRSLLSSCKKRGIEVIYEGEVSEDWNIKPGISEEFVRMQRERRRLEADQTILGEKA